MVKVVRASHGLPTLLMGPWFAYICEDSLARRGGTAGCFNSKNVTSKPADSQVFGKTAMYLTHSIIELYTETAALESCSYHAACE